MKIEKIILLPQYFIIINLIYGTFNFMFNSKEFLYIVGLYNKISLIDNIECLYLYRFIVNKIHIILLFSYTTYPISFYLFNFKNKVSQMFNGNFFNL